MTGLSICRVCHLENLTNGDCCSLPATQQKRSWPAADTLRPCRNLRSGDHGFKAASVSMTHHETAYEINGSFIKQGTELSWRQAWRDLVMSVMRAVLVVAVLALAIGGSLVAANRVTPRRAAKDARAADEIQHRIHNVERNTP